MQLSIKHNPAFAVVRAEIGADEEIRIESGAMMAMSGGVTLESKMEGGLKKGLVRATGTGQVVCACYGAMQTYDLAAGEQLVLDSGHLVAYEDTLTYTTRKVTSGLMQTLKSGEGLVFEFTGPGRVWAQ